MKKKLNIYGYIDYRKYLKDYYELQKKQTRYFSYRYFSNKAGFSSHNVLKQVISGERNIAYNSIGKFCSALNFSSRECDYFRLLVLFGQSKVESEKNELFKEMSQYKKSSKVKKLSELQFQMYSEWHHAVIREMITFIDVKDNYDIIAKLFSPAIKPGQVKKSLLLLESLGLIKKDSTGKWVQNDPIIKTAPEIESLSIRNFNRKMIRLAENAIEKVQPEGREISGLTVGISKGAFKRVKQKIQDFKDEILNDILNDTSKSEEVYQLNFQLFPLLQKNRKRNGGGE
jgi:uncharacterized protein (TIGR02147 family)